jgi:uncharacterized protein YoxC
LSNQVEDLIGDKSALDQIEAEIKEITEGVDNEKSKAKNLKTLSANLSQNEDKN